MSTHVERCHVGVVEGVLRSLGANERVARRDASTFKHSHTYLP